MHWGQMEWMGASRMDWGPSTCIQALIYVTTFVRKYRGTKQFENSDTKTVSETINSEPRGYGGAGQLQHGIEFVNSEQN